MRPSKQEPSILPPPSPCPPIPQTSVIPEAGIVMCRWMRAPVPRSERGSFVWRLFRSPQDCCFRVRSPAASLYPWLCRLLSAVCPTACIPSLVGGKAFFPQLANPTAPDRVRWTGSERARLSAAPSGPSLRLCPDRSVAVRDKGAVSPSLTHSRCPHRDS